MQKVILGVLYVALVVYTLVDVVQSDDEERHGLPKFLWVVAIILLPLIGSIAWILTVYIARRKKGRAIAADWERAASPSPAPQQPRRDDKPPAGPEDDPEYLWLLEQAKIKREREERERRQQEGDEPGA
ncbi:PLD nuclease N-terminal domain-containing protein [Myceligenerans crystallogenes]|uniref:Cardiolipin synthase N-terminal domain-containing protein n=1 Tax=Myceligenerans crystallogenes TaxID=316335 RepID=A0ABP4ZFQ4_9MICO